MVAGESNKAGASTRSGADSEGARRETRTSRRAHHRSGGPNLAPGLTRLAYAWTRASTELLVGTAEVAGNLLRNLTDDVYDEAPLADRMVDDEDAAPRRQRRSARGSIARLSDALADHLVDALDQSAEVLTRSADGLADSYDRAGRRNVEDAADDAARAKQKASTAGERPDTT